MFDQDLIGFSAYRQDRQENGADQTESTSQTQGRQSDSSLCCKTSQSFYSSCLGPQDRPASLAIQASQNGSLKRKIPHRWDVDNKQHHDLQTVVAYVLRHAVMCGDDRSFWPCYKPANGSGSWTTVKTLVPTADQLAELCLEKGIHWAIRFRHHLRVGVIDLDNHGAIHWTPEDSRLRRLIATAEAHGCGASLIPSPRGLHVWILAPVALNKYAMHWLLAELAHRAELDPEDPTIDTFPNLKEGAFHFDPKTAPHCGAIRLPGQLEPIPGAPFTDPLLIWRDLAFQLEVSSTGEAWDDLLAASDARRRAWQTEQRNRRHQQRKARSVGADARATASRLVGEAVWTAPGQSNDHLGNLATAGWLFGHRQDWESLACFIERHAKEAPGFDRFASDETKRQLPARAKDWAKCCLKHPPQGSASGSGPAPSKDASRNIRLRNQTTLKLIHAARKAAQKDGAAAARLSDRKVSEATGLHRNTLKKLAFKWVDLVMAALFRPCPAPPLVAGTHPPSKGLYQETLAPTDHSPPDQIHLSPPCPASNPPPPDRNLCRPPTPTDQTILPTKNVCGNLPEFVSEKRRREREELARWLEDHKVEPSPAPPAPAPSPEAPPVGSRVLIDRGAAGWTACLVVAVDAARWIFEALSDGRILQSTPHPGIWKPCA